MRHAFFCVVVAVAALIGFPETLRFGRRDFLPYAARMRDWIYGGNPGYACYVTGLGFNCRRRNVFGQFFPSTPSIPGGVSHVLNGEYDLPAGGMALWAIASE